MHWKRAIIDFSYPMSLTLFKVVAARVDLLDSREKVVLQHASIVGRTSGFPVCWS